MNRKVLVMNPGDNVGVLLENAEADDTCTPRDRPVTILETIEFAHKVALADISEKSWVVKYGESIGYANSDIKKGQWVHVHNMACDRGK